MQTTAHIISLILALTGALLAIADQIAPLAQINPQLAHWWPVVLAAATIVDRFLKLVLNNVTSAQAAKALAIIAAGAWAFLLGGCETVSAADREYRRKVESQDFGVAGTYDRTTKQLTGEVKTSIHFRNPDAEGLSK